MMRTTLVASLVAETIRSRGPSSLKRLTREMRREHRLSESDVAAGVCLAASLGHIERVMSGLAVRWIDRRQDRSFYR
jgi:hypothetical protein